MTTPVNSTRRVAVVTGAGRGLGMAYALALAARGYAVVVNDVGVGLDGGAEDTDPANEVVKLIRRDGGEAVASCLDISDWSNAGELIETAVSEFGALDILVNNAGIIRDSVLYKLTSRQWNDVLGVHLTGTAATSHHAAVHWRNRCKSGEAIDGRLINTTSPAGMFGNVGQSNYSAAKAGIIGFTLTASLELARYGVTANVIAPLASTRMLGSVGVNPDSVQSLDPAHVARVIASLAGPGVDVTGRVFVVAGRNMYIAQGWSVGPTATVPTDCGTDDMDTILASLESAAPPNIDVLSGMPTDAP